MRIQARFALVSMLLFVAGTCAAKEHVPAARSADETEIRAGTEAWNAAYNAGDIDTIVALYAEDAVLMPPNAKPSIGHAPIKTFLAKDSAAAKAEGLIAKDGKSTVGISGNLAWHAGTDSVVDAVGKTVGTGKYIEVWRKTNGKWLMIRDIWNDDAPQAK